MKIFNLFVLVLLAITAQAGDLSKLILPGKTFGADWEIAQPNIREGKAAPNYINRKLPHQPVVTVEIYEFQSPDAARAMWKKKFEGSDLVTLLKKVKGMADTYEYVPPPGEMKEDPMMKRFMLFGRYMLTVEQAGSKDDRKIFIEKYAEVIKRNAEVVAPNEP